MRKITKFFAAALLFGTAVSPAMAEGGYGALDLGRTTAKDACVGGLAGGCNDTATATRIAAGYQFTPMMAAEFSYGMYGKANLGVGDWQTRGFQASGIVMFPTGHDFSVFGKAGIARTELKLTASSRSATSTNLALGIGAQYEFNTNVAFRAQYEDLGKVGDTNTTGTTKVTLLTVGAVLRF